MGSTSHRSLATGSLLWGMGFQPQIVVGVDDNVCFVKEYVQGTKEVVVGTPLDFDGSLAAGYSTNSGAPAINEAAYMPGATALQFENEGDPTITCTVIGRNQFGDSVTEAVTVSASPTVVYTKHCYTFIESVTPTVVTGWAATSDKLRVGFEHNEEADCPYPLPFRVKDADHIQAITIAGTIFDGSDITVSKVYNTVTVKNSASVQATTAALSVAAITLVNGAAEVY